MSRALTVLVVSFVALGSQTARAQPRTVTLAPGVSVQGGPSSITVLGGANGARTAYACSASGAVHGDFAPSAGEEEVRSCVTTLENGWEAYAIAMFSGADVLWALEAEFTAGLSIAAREVVDTGADLRELLVTQMTEDGSDLFVYAWHGSLPARVFSHGITGGMSDPEFVRRVQFVAGAEGAVIELHRPGRASPVDRFAWDAASFAFRAVPRAPRPVPRAPRPAHR